MSSEHSSDVKFEIGHVLFIDIVGYSKLLINEQTAQMETLRQIVRGTEQFRTAEAEGKLLRLPTGDGGALVFRNSPEAPALCALEISRELKNHPELKVRMAIHSGPVNAITDLNEQANIAGAGINYAQRVMDCGDAGHILLSRHLAEDLEAYPRWEPLLHDLGQTAVKHGVITLLGQCQELAGRKDDARASFLRAISIIKPTPDAIVPVDARELPCFLAWDYAGLGDKEKALAQARQGVTDYRNDVSSKPFTEGMLAQIEARFGKTDAALDLVTRLLEVPAGLTVGNLRVEPAWDPLRKDPRFQKLAGTSASP